MAPCQVLSLETHNAATPGTLRNFLSDPTAKFRLPLVEVPLRTSAFHLAKGDWTEKGVPEWRD